MRLAVLSCLALAAPPLAAETRQHGNVIFDVPAGWTVGATRSDGTLVLLSDLPDDECPYCRIYLTVGDKGQVPLEAYLLAQSRRLADPEATDPPRIEPMSKAERVALAGRPAALMGQKSDGDLQFLIAVQLFGRVELVGFDGPAYDEDDLARTMRVFQRDMVPLVEGARFVSEGAPPLMPPARPGARTGTYWGTQTGWTLGLDATMQMQIRHRWLTFWPDGHFYDGTPPEGRAPFDPPARQARGDMSWGTYAESGGGLTLSYASGVVEQLAVTGDGLEADGTALTRIETLPDGTVLDGVLTTMFYSGFTPGSGLSGGVSAYSVTEFHPDGTWRRGSGGGAFAGFDAGGGFATSSEHEESGRYQVTNGLVVRRGRDGATVARDLIFKAGTDIWIGSDVLGPSGG